ncbi:MAG: type II secretion system protein [Planctomycetes bacterium]|nr:type II secretion system protein [Planctomycetota bacterium]
MRAASALSLVDLLVVACIVAILSALMLPALRMVRETARTVQCQSSLRQVGMGIATYMDENRGFFPTARQDGVVGAYGSYKHWFEHLQECMDGGDGDGNGSLDRRDLQSAQRNVLKDCPSRRPSTQIFQYGYGLNGCLRMPERYHRSYWDVSSGYYVDYRVSAVTRLSTRALVGDGADWHITVDNPKYPTAWVPDRHRGASNYLFCDMHVERLPAAAARLAISNPQ